MTAHNALDAEDVFFLDDVPADDDIGNATFTIGELAVEFGITVRTIRLYEERGLLNPGREGTRRVYRQRERITLEQIQRGLGFGLSLGEIAEFLTGTDGPFQAPVLIVPAERGKARIEILRKQRDEIDRTIRDLESLLKSMRR